jgi:ABC-2 type transport system permease protein
MMAVLRRHAEAYGAIAAMVPKLFLAYKIWVWMEFVVQILAITVFVYFWRAVYAQTDTLGGLNLQQTLNYILLAQVLLPALQSYLIFEIGYLIREGQVGIELLRPVDFQLRYYVQGLANMALTLALKLPLLLLAWAVFGLRLTADPAVWTAFLVSLLLGATVLFLFDWIFACLAFYSTEVWGLGVLREGVATFFSGALIPLVMMPDWLQSVAYSLPFAQVVYVPVSILSGVTPLGDAPRLWLVQVAWVLGLALVSRVIFNHAVKKVTVQGG